MSTADTVKALQRQAQEAEVERLKLRDELDVWRERAERAEARLASITGMQRQELAQDVAERQRAACALAVHAALGEAHALRPDPTGNSTPLVTMERFLAFTDALHAAHTTPLVTEVES